MTISLYKASVPVFRQYLARLAGVGAEAEAQLPAMHADSTGVLAARVHPIRFSRLRQALRQVHIATAVARGAPDRFAALGVAVGPDTETGFGDLNARTHRADAALDSRQPVRVDGEEARTIPLTVGRQSTFQGLPYRRRFALPSRFCLATTAYAMLRHNGIDVGPRDVMGRT